MSLACALLLPVGLRAQQASLDSLLVHIRDLSSSTYEGRLAGTRAFLSAADYVVGELERYGVQPYNGNWAQFFETECNQIENCTFNS